MWTNAGSDSDDTTAMRSTGGYLAPVLVGVWVSAPYFHNGSAETLRDVIHVAGAGAMGAPFTLSESEMQDLEDFLKGL